MYVKRKLDHGSPNCDLPTREICTFVFIRVNRINFLITRVRLTSWRIVDKSPA